MALSRKPQEIVEDSKNPLLAKHESWGRVPVGDIADILNGFAFKSSKFTNDKGMPLIRIRDVGKDSSETFYDGEFDETYLVNDGDLLVGMDGDFRAAIWKGGKALLNQRVCKISLKTSEYDFRFLSYVLQPYLDAIHAETSAVTVKHLSSKSISEIPLPLPPKEQQKRIVTKIEELFSHIDAGIEALKKAKQLLKQYRQSVLKAAVTGELTKDLPGRQAGWRDYSFRNISGKRVPESSDKYFAYVLECEDGSLYKGFSKDLFQRIDQHLTGQGAKWTKEHRPVSIIHFEEFDTEKEAVEREKYFKSGSGREWLNQVREEQNKKYEPASQLLERILKERRQKWEEQQLEQFKAKGKMPKDDKWKVKYKDPVQVENVAELEDLPSAWEWVCLDSLIVDGPQNGLYLPKTKYGSGVPIVRIDDFQDGYIRPYDNLQKVNANKSEVETYSLQTGNLVINRVNSPTHLGKCMVVKEGYDPCLFESNMMKSKLSSNVSTDFVDYYIQSKFGRSKLIRNAKWAVNQASINQQDVKNTEITLPPFEEQTEITRLVSEKFDGIDRLNNELDIQLSKAEKNRQSILASAFLGKV